MALQAQGFTEVLTAIKDAAATLQLYGLESQDDFVTSGSWTSDTNEAVTFGNIETVDANTRRIQITSSVTFDIIPSSAEIRVQGVRLLNSTGQVLIEQAITGEPKDFPVQGEFTVTAFTVRASN